jgi:hypothetical protein
MWGHVEFFNGGLIRVFDDGAVFGEQYRYSLAFKRHGEEVIEYVGAYQTPTFSQARTILAATRQVGLRPIRVRLTGARTGVREYW